jgi:hypothetical protein
VSTPPVSSQLSACLAAAVQMRSRTARLPPAVLPSSTSQAATEWCRAVGGWPVVGVRIRSPRPAIGFGRTVVPARSVRATQFPAAAAVRRTSTGHGVRTRPCRCIRLAPDLLPPQPGPLLDRGLDAAEPHIRSPLAAAAPRFPVPEGVGPGRAGPICQAASRSQGLIRSARRDRRRSPPRRWLKLVVSRAGSGRLQRGALRHLAVGQVAP